MTGNILFCFLLQQRDEREILGNKVKTARFMLLNVGRYIAFCLFYVSFLFRSALGMHPFGSVSARKHEGYTHCSHFIVFSISQQQPHIVLTSVVT